MAAGVAGVFALFVAGVLVESGLRRFSREPIPVVVADGLPAKVAAYVQPDFLWAGEAWWINIETEVPVQLVIDEAWEAKIPSGRHTVHSNHDMNNTTKFSANRWWKTPARIAVKEMSQQPSAGDVPKAVPDEQRSGEEK